MAMQAEFMAEADASHRPATQVACELMGEYVQRQREARKYEAFQRSKVDTARHSMEACEGLINVDIEAQIRRSSDTG